MGHLTAAGTGGEIRALGGWAVRQAFTIQPSNNRNSTVQRKSCCCRVSLNIAKSVNEVAFEDNIHESAIISFAIRWTRTETLRPSSEPPRTVVQTRGLALPG